MDEEGSVNILKSNLSICGGKAWKQVLEGNSLSFESVHKINSNANIGEIETKRKSLYDKTSSSFELKSKKLKC